MSAMWPAISIPSLEFNSTNTRSSLFQETSILTMPSLPVWPLGSLPFQDPWRPEQCLWRVYYPVLLPFQDHLLTLLMWRALSWEASTLTVQSLSQVSSLNSLPFQVHITLLTQRPLSLYSSTVTVQSLCKFHHWVTWHFKAVSWV